MNDTKEKVDILIKSLEKHPDEAVNSTGLYYVGYNDGLNDAKEALINLGYSIVSTGYWTEIPYAESIEGILIPNYECSCCHFWFRTNDRYCGNCGAKMDKTEGKV